MTKNREIPKVETGRYMVNGKRARVVQVDDTVHVNYDDGCFTCAYPETFACWNVQRTDD